MELQWDVNSLLHKTHLAPVRPAIHHRDEFQPRRTHLVHVVANKGLGVGSGHWHSRVKDCRRLTLIW